MTARRAAPRKQSAEHAHAPISASEFDAALNALDLRPPFAIAVSGGADSLALMLLAADWAKQHKLPPPQAITVDHGLREGSAFEAARVAAWARKHAVPHSTLKWTGRKPSRNIQALARDARYRLIAGHMRAQGIATLLTGHTRDDQAETFLLRLGRGSGLEGLSGMAPVTPFPLTEFADLKIARPLLSFSHARLKATLRALKQPWISDPSNDNDRFTRVQIRKLLPALARVGITDERVAGAASNLRRARHALAAVLGEFLAHVEISPWGYALLDPTRFAETPREIALRGLARLLEGIGGAEYPPRFEHTETALDWLISRRAVPKGRTLGGCRLACRADGRVLVTREEAALAKQDPVLQLGTGERALWDRRYAVSVSKAPATARFEVRRLGPLGLKLLDPEAKLPAVEPRRIAACAPALWLGARLIAGPLQSDRGEVLVSMTFVGVSRLTPG